MLAVSSLKVYQEYIYRISLLRYKSAVICPNSLSILSAAYDGSTQELRSLHSVQSIQLPAAFKPFVSTKVRPSVCHNHFATNRGSRNLRLNAKGILLTDPSMNILIIEISFPCNGPSSNIFG